MSDPGTARRPIVLRPGEGDAMWSLGAHFAPKVTGDHTDGRFTLMEALAFRSTEPPLHIHHREDEAWYLLDGKMTFRVGDEDWDVTSGTFVFAPRGVPHGFTVEIEPTRVLVFASPTGFEHLVSELGVPAAGEVPPPGLTVPPPEVLGPVFERYGIEAVGPTLRTMRGEG